MNANNVNATVLKELTGREGTYAITGTDEVIAPEGYVFESITFLEDSIVGAITDLNEYPLTLTAYSSIPSLYKAFGTITRITLIQGSAIGSLKRYVDFSILDERLDFSQEKNTQYYPITF